jgi:hypothetical protein
MERGFFPKQALKVSLLFYFVTSTVYSMSRRRVIQPNKQCTELINRPKTFGLSCKSPVVSPVKISKPTRHQISLPKKN